MIKKIASKIRIGSGAVIMHLGLCLIVPQKKLIVEQWPGNGYWKADVYLKPPMANVRSEEYDH